jgi:formylglycine-generating enzyme required for sulfatase activity
MILFDVSKTITPTPNHPKPPMKNKLQLAFVFLAILCVARLSQGQSFLRIAETNNQFILYWPNPSNGTNCVLTSTSRSALGSWATATDAIPYNFGSMMAMAVAKSPSTRLFRLALVAPTVDGMALIPAGTYTIGDVSDTNYNGDAAPTNVYVSAFYIETNLVSYSEWESIFAYATSQGYSFTNSGTAQASNQPMQPVETIDWYDTVKWCNARSQKAGLMPVYFTDAAFSQLYTNGETDAVYANWSANGYRLPTEAEWEKAARGGLSGHRFPWGDTISESQANYRVMNELQAFFYNLSPDGYNPLVKSETPPYSSPVASFAANGYGLYDMAGNLEEWCWDWYDANPESGSAYAGGTDPHGTSSSPIYSRVLRSGAWGDLAVTLRCADRYSTTTPADANWGEGFRCVRKY